VGNFSFMADRYAEHRRRLIEEIGPEGLAVIPAATEVIRNHDVPYQFRQDSAFWYLTGFHEPDAVAVIAPGHEDGDFSLFVRPKDPAQEVWTGIRAGKEGAASGSVLTLHMRLTNWTRSSAV